MSNLFYLPIPEVLGSVSDQKYAEVAAQSYDEDWRIGHSPDIPEVAWEFAQNLAQMSVRPLDRFKELTIITRPIEPGSCQLALPVGEWHADPSDAVLISDVLPTQFAYGSLKAVIRLMELPRSFNEPLTPSFVSKICEVMCSIDVKELKKTGIKTWAPKPRQAVLATTLNPHRGQINTTGAAINRCLTLLTED